MGLGTALAFTGIFFTAAFAPFFFGFFAFAAGFFAAIHASDANHTQCKRGRDYTDGVRSVHTVDGLISTEESRELSENFHNVAAAGTTDANRFPLH